MSSADRDITKLDPSFLEKVTPFLLSNPEIFVTEASRTDERQKEMIAKNLSKIARSLHQDWLAIDIAFHWSELYPSDHSKRRKVADSAKSYWIDWWYDLWNWDKVHFQNDNTILPHIKTLMWFYEEMYKKEIEAKWKNTKFQNPAMFIEKMKGKSDEEVLSELVYLMGIIVNR